jgi:hypothetical protein
MANIAEVSFDATIIGRAASGGKRPLGAIIVSEAHET